MVVISTKITVGAYIRAKRRAANLTLREVAKAINVSEVFLGEVERDVRLSVKPERLLQLEQQIPGFSALEAQRQTADSRPVQLSLSDAPPQYKELGLALARRMQRQDLKQRELDELRRILLGDASDD